MVFKSNITFFFFYVRQHYLSDHSIFIHFDNCHSFLQGTSKQILNKVFSYLWMVEAAQTDSFFSIPKPCASLIFEVEMKHQNK